MKRTLSILSVVLALGIAPGSSGAAARPDRSFGHSGWVATKIPGAKALAYALTVTGKRIIVAGQTVPKSGGGLTGAGQVFVARYRANGRLDRRFGSKGIFETSLPNKRGPFIANAIAPAGSGKLVVAGGYGQGSILVMRLTRDGRPDRSFGKAGIATIAVGGVANSVAVQPDGSILVGSSDGNTAGRPMVVARLTPAGAVDSGFGTGGIANTIFWDPNQLASAGVLGLAVAANGNITGFGHVDSIGSSTGGGRAGVFQLSSDGQPASGFGTGGNALVGFPDPSGGFAGWLPCAFGVDGQGRITVTGGGLVGPTHGISPGIISARLTPEGALDPTYGEAADGRAFLSGPRTGGDPTCGAAVSSDGTMTVGIGSALAQLTPGGAPNAAFGRGGIVAVGKPQGVVINAAAASGPNRLILAGFAGQSLYLSRYLLP